MIRLISFHKDSTLMHEPNVRFCLLWGYLTSAWSVGIYGRKGIELEGHIWAEPGPDLKDLGLDK